MSYQGLSEIMESDGNRHLDEDEIEEYSMGVVPEIECARFDEHLLVCGACRIRVAESEDYLAAMHGAGLQFRQQARKLRERQRGTRQVFLPLISRSYAVALVATFAVLVALLGLGALRRWVREAQPIFALRLEAVRGAGIEAHAPAGRTLLLKLDLAGLPAQASYRVETVDRLGNAVWQGMVPSVESKAIASLPGMRAGVYFVRVYASSGELLREYGFDVQG